MTLDPTTPLDTHEQCVSRVDMHCHSTASQISKLGVQRAAGLPECATPPEEVYELAKRRGMDFVTITDHDTIDGVMQIADRPDVFVSEELTASFRGEPAMAVHVLCYDITPDDHDWLQANAHDVELCAAYMYERDIACALAHPYYIVGAPLHSRHRRRLAELFGVWEVRNGARAPELNRPAATYVATRDGIGIGGSDDHAGVDIGRTYTESPPACTPQEFLTHMRAGRVTARGAQGSAAKWAHAAIVLAARSLAPGHSNRTRTRTSPDPQRVMTMVRRLLREGDARQGATGSGGTVSPEDARCLLRAWLAAVELDHLDVPGLIAYMQADDFSHADLYRRACRLHERKLRCAVELALRAARGEAEVLAAAEGLFEGCIAAIPYAPATAFLASEQTKLARMPFGGLSRFGAPGAGDGERPRVAILADGIGSTHGVTRTIEEIRTRGVSGYEIEVVGTDPEVDRRLSAVAEIDVPYYPGLQIGVPSLPAAVQTLADGAFDAIHVCSPGPVGVAGALLARALGLPLIGSYHTELTAYADLRSGRPDSQARWRWPSVRSTAPATSSSPPASPPTRRWPGSGCPRSGSCAGTGAWTPHASTLRCARRACWAGNTAASAGSTSCTRAGSRARRAPSCWQTRSWRPARASRGCTWCWPAADPSRTDCASASAPSTRRSSAGCPDWSSRAHTRARTCSCSPARPTRSAR